MRQPKHPHTVLSNRQCKECGKQLKQNLVDKCPNANHCYKHRKKRG